jgi:hypothetical protein
MAKAKKRHMKKGTCKVISAGKRCVCRSKTTGVVSFKKAKGGRCRGKM